MSRLVTVAHFWDAPEMYAALAALRSAGLYPYASEYFHAMNNPMLFLALGGVRIQVPEPEAAFAVEVIRRCRNGQGAEDWADTIYEANRDDGLICLQCGSGNYFRLKSWTYGFAILLAFGIYAPMTTGQLLCRSCGHKWREREGAA